MISITDKIMMSRIHLSSQMTHILTKSIYGYMGYITILDFFLTRHEYFL